MQNRIQYQLRKDEDEINEIAREGDGPKHLCDKEYKCPLSDVFSAGRAKLPACDLTVRAIPDSILIQITCSAVWQIY